MGVVVDHKNFVVLLSLRRLLLIRVRMRGADVGTRPLEFFSIPLYAKLAFLVGVGICVGSITIREVGIPLCFVVVCQMLSHWGWSLVSSF